MICILHLKLLLERFVYFIEAFPNPHEDSHFMEKTRQLHCATAQPEVGGSWGYMIKID